VKVAVARFVTLGFVCLGLSLPLSSCRIGSREKSREVVAGRPIPAGSLPVPTEPADGVTPDGVPVPSPLSSEAAGSQVDANVLWSPDQRVAQAAFHYLLGEVLLQRGNVSEASTMLSSAYALDATPFLGSRAIVAKAEAGQLDEATKEAERLVLLYPRNVPAKILFARLLVRKGSFSQAISQLDNVIKSKPEDELPYVMLVELWARDGNRAKARTVARKLTQVLPDSAVGWSMVARLCLLDGARKDMLSAAKKAWSIQATPDNALLYAVALELNGNVNEALRVYEVAYKSADSSEKLTTKLVDLYRQVGNLEEALRVLSDVHRKTGNSGPAPSVGLQIQRVAILWELKRDTEALKILEEISRTDHRPDLVASLLGYGYERLRRFDDALKAYGKVTKDFLLYKDVGIRRCLILKEQGKIDEAASLVKIFLAQPDPGWEFYVLAAEIESARARNKEAYSLCLDGWRRYPDQFRLLFLAGVYMEKNGDAALAMKTMRDLIKIQPDNSSALNFLGYLIVEKGGDLDEARKLIERALETRPGDGAYLDSLGWCLFKMGQIDKAEELLLRAIQKSPDEGVIMEHLAEVAVKRGQIESAIGWLEKAKSQELDPRDRSRIEARLEELRRSR